MIEREGQQSQGGSVEGSEARAARFFVGATKNPDGTVDYSKALYVKPGSEFEATLAESSKASLERHKQQRTERLEGLDAMISKYEGQGNGVFFQLEKSLFLARERVKAGDERSSRLVNNLELQKKVLGEVTIGNPSPAESMGRLEGLKDRLERQVMAGSDRVMFGNRSYKITELYDSIRELGVKLDAESQKEIKVEAPKESRAEKAEAQEGSEEEVEAARKNFERSLNFLVNTLEHPDTRSLFQPFRDSSPSVEDYNRLAKEVMALNKRYMGEQSKSDQLKREYLEQARQFVSKEAS